MSDAVSTSPASPPSAEPTWLATIAPVAWLIIPSSGPAIARASSGSALPSACVAWAATGSTSTFQTSVVPTIHSARDHAAVVVTPDGNAVAESSQWSARRTASATAAFCFSVTLGSGAWAACLRAMSMRDVPVDGAVVGLHQRLDLGEERGEVGHPARRPPGAACAPEQRARGRAGPARPRRRRSASKGVPLKGLRAARRGRDRSRRARRPGCRSWLQTTRAANGGAGPLGSAP